MILKLLNLFNNFKTRLSFIINLIILYKQAFIITLSVIMYSDFYLTFNIMLIIQINFLN